MLRAERLSAIKQLLIEQKSIASKDISDKFGVSEVTARKDLDKLEDEGFLVRTFGGAILQEKQSDDSFDGFSGAQDKKQELERRLVVKAALKCINKGDAIYLGSGRTCSILAQSLPQDYKLSIVTNNISAVPTLVEKGMYVYLIGGEVARVKDSGPLFSCISDPIPYFENICISKAFTSCYGFSEVSGITVESMISTYIYKALEKVQSEWYMMITQDKYTKTGMHRVGDLDMINHLIAPKTPDNVAKVLENGGVSFIEVE